jgi:hypothetical protein
VAKHAEAAFSGARAACATLQTAAVPTHYLWRTLAPKLPRDLPRGALQAAVAGQIRLQSYLSNICQEPFALSMQSNRSFGLSALWTARRESDRYRAPRAGPKQRTTQPGYGGA